MDSSVLRSRGDQGVVCQIRGREHSSPLLIWLVSLFRDVEVCFELTRMLGSERARNAKTAGATLAEAGKINESLMYLGQCLQMQSDNHDNTKVIFTLLFYCVV